MENSFCKKSHSRLYLAYSISAGRSYYRLFLVELRGWQFRKRYAADDKFIIVGSGGWKNAGGSTTRYVDAA